MDVAEAWDPAGVARVVAMLRDVGVTSFRIEVAVAGLDLKLELRRGPDGDLVPVETVPSTATAADAAASAQADEDLVTAPLLGVFYRRSAPDQAPFAEVEQQVEAGQVLGLLEVMKTYHEVTAPRAGVIAAFLVEDGQFVEYGAPIVRLESVVAEPARS